MEPITSVFFVSVMAVMAAILALCYKARAAPRFALQRADREGGRNQLRQPSCSSDLMKGDAHLQGVDVPLPPFLSAKKQPIWFGFAKEDGKKERNRERRALQASTVIETCDECDCDGDGSVGISDKPGADSADKDAYLNGPSLARKQKPYGMNRRLYKELVDAFIHSGNRDRALVFKSAIHKRLPGYRRLIERAYDEACREAFHIN